MGFFVHTPMLVLAILVSHMTHFLIHMDEKSHTQVRKQNALPNYSSRLEILQKLTSIMLSTLERG